MFWSKQDLSYCPCFNSLVLLKLNLNSIPSFVMKLCKMQSSCSFFRQGKICIIPFKYRGSKKKKAFQNIKATSELIPIDIFASRSVVSCDVLQSAWLYIHETTYKGFIETLLANVAVWCARQFIRILAGAHNNVTRRCIFQIHKCIVMCLGVQNNNVAHSDRYLDSADSRQKKKPWRKTDWGVDKNC